MTISDALQSRFNIVPDYYMPGRDELEPGSYALNGGPNKVADGDPTAASPEAAADGTFFGQDGISFADLLDVLNPLQHIPVIADLYRSITGDEISPGARLAGGTLYGGPLGFLSALANTVVEEATGRDIGGNVLALFSGGGDPDNSELAVPTPAAHDAVKPAGVNPDASSWNEARSATFAVNTPAAPPPLGHLAGVPPRAGPNPAFNGSPAQPGKVLAAGGLVPELSPAAFQTLLSSVNDRPPRLGRPGLSASDKMPQVRNGTIRDAGLELNRLLRPRAERQN
ncbi:MAG: hypothetical protein H8E30_03535 [Alphaproteobacteria bacterium]|nr:hypothetical protein [Alphaproteobacteria bacterium]